MTVLPGWRYVPLQNVVRLQRGFDLPNKQRRDGPYPVLTSGATGGFHDEGPIPGPGVVIGRATNLGEPKWSAGPYWPHNTVLFVRDFLGNDPKWIYYWFASTDLAGYDSGSVQPMLNRNYVSQHLVLLPPVEVQRAIAEVLGALDNKIAGNERLAVLLRDLDDSSFSAAARDAERVPLGRLAVFTKGVSYRSADLHGSGGMLTLKSITASGVYNSEGVKPFSGMSRPDHHVRPGDVILAQTDLTQAGSVVGRAVRIPQSSDRGTLVASLDLLIARPRPGTSVEVLSGLLREDRFRRFCSSNTSGTTVLHLNSRALPEYLAPVLRPEAATTFTKQSAERFAATSLLIEEQRSLQQLRDTLLPHLMSGRLRVKDAEKQVEEVV